MIHGALHSGIGINVLTKFEAKRFEVSHERIGREMARAVKAKVF